MASINQTLFENTIHRFLVSQEQKVLLLNHWESNNGLTKVLQVLKKLRSKLPLHSDLTNFLGTENPTILHWEELLVQTNPQFTNLLVLQFSTSSRITKKDETLLFEICEELNASPTKKAVFICLQSQILEKVKYTFPYGSILKFKDEADFLISAYLMEAGCPTFQDGIKRLISGKKVVDCRDVKGGTVLHFASEKGHKEIALALMEIGALVNATDTEGETPLHRAARSGHNLLVTYLLDYGAKVDSRSTWGTLRYRIDWYRQSIGCTPLHFAAERGHRDVIKILVNHGADVKVKNDTDWTPLHAATDRGHKDVVECLVAYGAVVNVKDVYGWTPLHSAAEKGYDDIVEVLIEHGALINVGDETGSTPLHLAARYGYKDIVKYLLNHGAKVNARDSAGYTPLHMAVLSGNIDVVLSLLNRGSDVNATNENLETPMHLCEFNRENKREIILALVENNADMQAKDKNERTAEEAVRKLVRMSTFQRTRLESF